MTKLPRSAPAIAIIAAVALTAGTGGAVAAAMITSAQIKDGTIQSIDVKNRTLKTADLSPRTVRPLRGAYGAVNAAGTVSKQSGGITVTRPNIGIYCVTTPGFSSANRVIVVSPDYSENDTAPASGAQSVVETYSGVCDAPAFGVITLVQNPGATAAPLTNQPFTFQVQ